MVADEVKLAERTAKPILATWLMPSATNRVFGALNEIVKHEETAPMQQRHQHNATSCRGRCIVTDLANRIISATHEQSSASEETSRNMEIFQALPKKIPPVFIRSRKSDNIAVTASGCNGW